MNKIIEKQNGVPINNMEETKKKGNNHYTLKIVNKKRFASFIASTLILTTLTGTMVGNLFKKEEDVIQPDNPKFTYMDENEINNIKNRVNVKSNE